MARMLLLYKEILLLTYPPTQSLIPLSSYNLTKIEPNSGPLEKEMATHSSVLAWRIPGMGEPGGLPSMGSHSQT